MAKHAAQRVQSENRAYPRFIRPTAAALAVAACFSNPALANPTAPTVVHGTASFSTAGNILNVTNSYNAIINWGSFSIGVNELTRFIQPSALSAVLNRVTGQDPSAILGALQSNGRVFLLNPNGIVFGSGAQINVAGLVASTLNLSNDDFLNNRLRFTDGAGAGSVVNNGSITGGNVYLVGNAVTNNGLISSPNGEVVLAAGNSVELVNPGTPNLRVEVVAPDNEARNLGTITAEAGRIGIFAGLINNSGTLNASSAVSEGGRIWLKAKKDITLTSTSVIDASGKGGGEIIAFADNNMYVDGSLNASAPVSGNGGFIETSGKNKVKIADSAVVTTAAANGNAGTWLLDPTDFIIGGVSGDISKTALESALGAGNVVISTVSYGDSTFYGGAGGTEGDILVQEAVSWGNANSLTLTAYRNVQVNESITNSGTGDINLNAGWDMLSPALTPNLTNSAGNIILNAAITTGGNVALNAAGNITQGNLAPITAANLQAASIYGSVSLADSANLVNTLTGSARGSFAFKNAGALTVGGSGITVYANGGNPAQNASINLSTTSGSLTIGGNLYAQGGAGDGGEGGAGGNASIVLASAGDLQINSSVTAQAGYGGFSGISTGGNGGNSAVTLTSGGDITINQSVYAYGGSGGMAYSSTPGGAGGNGVVSASAAGSLTVASYGGLLGLGGQGGYAPYGGTGGRGGDGKVMVTAGSITVNSGSQVQGLGGNGGDADDYYYGGSGFGGAGGDGTVQLTSTGSISVAGTVAAQGGWGGEGGEGGGIAGNGGNAAVSLASTGGAIAISYGGQVYADGGEGPYNAVGTTGGTASVNLSSAGATTISDSSVYANGGDGGQYGASTAGSGTVTVNASGPLSLTNNAYVFANGGGGGETGVAGSGAVNLISSGGITISGSEVYTYGGSGGYGGDGGNATTTIQANGGNVLIEGSSVYANGGSGDYYVSTGNGGTGVVNIGSAGSTAITDSYIYASGGYGAGYYAYGGSTANGGNAVVLISAAGALTVSNSLLDASGGTANSGQGGAAGLTMIAGGNIQFEGAEGSVYGGGSNGVGGDAGILMQSLGGNIVLDSYYDETLSAVGGGNTPGMKSVVISAAGNVSLVNDAGVYSSGTVGIFSGGNVSLDSSYVYAESTGSVTATGSLTLTNGSSFFGNGNAYIKTGGNVNVDNSGIVGNPDVFMTVGGVINLNNGAGVVAGAPTTIHLTFPMITSGGYFINGIEGVVFDPLTNTGFFANGSPAELGVNLLVTYGGNLNIPTDALIVAMGESTKPPDPEKDKNVFEDIEEGKKKDAPVCR